MTRKKVSKLFSRDYNHYDVASEMSPKSEFGKDGHCALRRKKLLVLITVRNM